MGLKNAPGEFQCFMEHCLDGLREDICVPYIDDIIVLAKHLRIMLSTFGKCFDGYVDMGLKLNPRSADSK